MKRAIIVAIVVLVIVIQLIPVKRTNPTVSQEIEAPSPVLDVLQQSCYDCHSNETEWPWYSYIAPVSWLVTGDVKEGREHMNLSTWDQYSDEDMEEFREEIWEEVEEGAMPIFIYKIMHSDARLTDQDMSILREWSQQAGQSDEESESEE